MVEEPVSSQYPLVAGVDEVGRGALFGPVVAAVVVLTESEAFRLAQLGVTDSKRLTAKRRSYLADQIRLSALDFRIAKASVQEIDRLNILQATLLAMRRAVLALKATPEKCLVDGLYPIPGLDIPQKALVRGDQRHIEISAASILAKVWRDALIEKLDKRYPGYDLASNKGYGSARHRQALRDLGLTGQHRRSFRSCKDIVI